MHGFVRIVFAVFAGIVLFLVVLTAGAWWKWGRGPEVRDHTMLVQPVRGPLPEYPPGGYTSGILASGDVSLHQVLENLRKAAADERVDGVVLTLGTVQGGFAGLQEIREAVGSVRAAGKPVYAWSDMLTFKDLYVATACDSIFLFPTAVVSLDGTYLDRMYFAGTLEKLGIVPEINRIESYKSAAEMVLRKDLSPQAREMLNWILDDVHPAMLRAVAEERGVSPAVLENALAGVLWSAGETVGMGLVDGLRDWGEFSDALPHHGDEDAPRWFAAEDYIDIEPGDAGLEKGDRRIAIVHAQGLIAGAESGQDPVLGTIMGHATVNADLQAALDDEDVVAVVFRVDSGGGSSLTSDRISRMVGRVDAEKPVIVSMVDLAASGGYTISYRARSIVANPATITGSIGSITGKMNLHGFYDRLGVSKDGVGRGPHADFNSDYRAWSDAEFALVREDHWEGYRDWIARIAEHRGLEPAAVDSVARGRVWTGNQALERGLVDRLGSLETAVVMAREAAGLEADEPVTRVHYPKAGGALSQILGTDVDLVGERLASRWFSQRRQTWDALGQSELHVVTVPTR